jgi:hypothetical protein
VLCIADHRTETAPRLAPGVTWCRPRLYVVFAPGARPAACVGRWRSLQGAAYLEDLEDDVVVVDEEDDLLLGPGELPAQLHQQVVHRHPQPLQVVLQLRTHTTATLATAEGAALRSGDHFAGVATRSAGHESVS